MKKSKSKKEKEKVVEVKREMVVSGRRKVFIKVNNAGCVVTVRKR